MARECFDGWETYPANNGNQLGPLPSIFDSNNVFGRNKKPLFSSIINVRTIGIYDAASTACNAKFYDHNDQVENMLKEDAVIHPRIRIISLCSSRTTSPLLITESLIRKIFTAYDVDHSFLHVMLSFGDAPQMAESRSRNISINHRSDGSRSISYQLRYAEQNHRSKSQPWSPRQTGIYHQRSLEHNFDLFLVLNPTKGSVLEERILNFQSHEAAQPLIENTLRFHLLPFASYIDNWRWYLRDVGDHFSDYNNRIMTLDLQLSSANLTFDEVQRLRDLNDKTLDLSGYCTSALSIIQGLQNLSEGKSEHVWSLVPYSERLKDFGENLAVLTARISNTIDLAAYFLELKNQQTAGEMNDTMATLTSKTNKDTTSVRWITYLTLIYLPASFVATLFGMNFFDYDPNRHRVVVATDLWIYVATWLPLTFITFVGYRTLKGYHESKEDSPLRKLRNFNARKQQRSHKNMPSSNVGLILPTYKSS